MKNIKNFLATYRQILQVIVIGIVAMLSVVGMQKATSVPVGLLVLAAASIVLLAMDYVLPKEQTVTSRSVDAYPDPWTMKNILPYVVYIGSFLTGFLIFQASGENPDDLLWIGPWGGVALGVTLLGPVLYHIIGYWSEQRKK